MRRDQTDPGLSNWESDVVQYVKFGSTGLRVSRICLGTMTFGLQCDEARSHAIMDAAAEERGRLPAELWTRLDDLTHGWRAVDAER